MDMDVPMDEDGDGEGDEVEPARARKRRRVSGLEDVFAAAAMELGEVAGWLLSVIVRCQQNRRFSTAPGDAASTEDSRWCVSSTRPTATSLYPTLSEADLEFGATGQWPSFPARWLVEWGGGGVSVAAGLLLELKQLKSRSASRFGSKLIMIRGGGEALG
ncbi:hypothetical protein C8R46DRAFT_1319136 [Mycena filopes]|nr:hypothetical protein C8R46DRAFT_1319136 [Mycena filopes]